MHKLETVRFIEVHKHLGSLRRHKRLCCLHPLLKQKLKVSWSW